MHLFYEKKYVSLAEYVIFFCNLTNYGIVRWKEYMKTVWHEDLQEYIFELDEIIFAWEFEPDADIQQVLKIAKSYKDNIDNIASFMQEDLIDFYGSNMTIENIKEKIGKPIIEIENNCVTYCEQQFDPIHIFSFEYLDDTFKELRYFAIDG